ncbi:MAG: hypothetical protein AW08_02043 [Candidatus Accumulibacter adjunctus]|uniref:Uncharacterized protein n=1 Tax=Candidatus Accumulibacter adjunctus TaxID=1454001 RepID=A0A011NSF9_9PROT|nr:MAG: hypothetical protein AW08_02043 [Candidatus Accumulibacter adjunctus]
MLTELTRSNFKSYPEARLPLAPLSFLIGANASAEPTPTKSALPTTISDAVAPNLT